MALPSKFAKACVISRVPLANFSISNTPCGPFHTTVLASLIIDLNLSTVFGPISKPISSAGIASNVRILVSVSLSNALPVTTSTPNSSLPSANANNSLAKSTLSNSTKDLPTSWPCAFKKVNAIPPPINTLSATFSKFLMTSILSDTLAPPKIATNGLCGFSSAPPIKLISFSSNKPATDVFMLLAIPTFDACALCAVPNASFTNTSPKDAQYLPNASSFLDSFLPSKSSKRVFSNINTSPASNCFTASSKALPLVSAINTTFLLIKDDNLSATGFNEFVNLSSSVLI